MNQGPPPLFWECPRCGEKTVCGNPPPEGPRCTSTKHLGTSYVPMLPIRDPRFPSALWAKHEAP